MIDNEMVSFTDDTTLMRSTEEICQDESQRPEKKRRRMQSMLDSLQYVQSMNEPENQLGCHATLRNHLKKVFYNLGYRVGSTPLGFIIASVLLSIACMTGLHKVRMENDPEYLFTPRDSTGKAERMKIEQLFPVDYNSTFDPSRVTRLQDVHLLVSAKDKGTMLRQKIWKELVALNDAISAISVEFKEKHFSYDSLCGRINGSCIENPISFLESHMSLIENGSMRLQFPKSSIPYLFPSFFGGVDLNESEGVLVSAKAIGIHFWLRRDDATANVGGLLWENALLRLCESREFEHIDLSLFIDRKLPEEIDKNIKEVKPYVFIIVLLTAIFSTLLTITSDCVRSKPSLGIMAAVSVTMATGSAFGFLAHCGVPFIFLNFSIPLLLLGIGLSDMFVVHSAWQRTRIQDEVSVRMGITYCEGVFPVTTTCLVLVCAFCVGYLTPLPSIQNFCLYCGVGVLFTYLWLVTLLGGILAVMGQMEKKQRHTFTFKRVVSKSEAGGINHADPWNPTDNEPHIISVFFRDHIGKVFNSSGVKVFVLIMFTVYLTGALCFCFLIKEEQVLSKVTLDDSYVNKYYEVKSRYFTDYTYTIQIVINDNLTYSNEQTMKALLKLHSDLEQLPHVGSHLTQSWILGFSRFLDNRLDLKSRIIDEPTFIAGLKEEYLPSHSPQHLDVVCSEDATKILASRFLIQAQDVKGTFQDKDLMEEVRSLLRDATFDAFAFNQFFPFFEGYWDLRTMSVQTLCLAVVAVMLVMLLFSPRPTFALWVGFSVISIQVGVLGYGSLWGLSYDSVATVCLLVSIGISVHNSIHILHVVLSSRSETVSEKLREGLFSFGLPLLQGGACSVIATLPFISVSSSAFRTIFRVTLLSTSFGLAHGIVLLPIMFSLLGPGLFAQGEVKPPRDRPDEEVIQSKVIA